MERNEFNIWSCFAFYSVKLYESVIRKRSIVRLKATVIAKAFSGRVRDINVKEIDTNQIFKKMGC